MPNRPDGTDAAGPRWAASGDGGPVSDSSVCADSVLRPFRFELPPGSRLRGFPGTGARGALVPSLERLLHIDRLNDVYSRVAGARDRYEFLLRTLDELGIRFGVSPGDVARIPATGPLLVVANHPFGAVDGMVLTAVLCGVRSDVKVIANYLLGRIPDLRDLFIFVDPFGGGRAAGANLAPVRQAVRWLKDGGVLATFPAGEVAHLSLLQRQVIEPPWSDSVARIARQTGASVLPVWFEGHNGPLFQMLGLLHPRLRTALLPREMFRLRDSSVDLRVGWPIPARRLAAFDMDDAAATDYLRRRTFLLRHREPPCRGGEADPRCRAAVPPPEPVVPPVAPALLRADVAALPEDAKLLSHEAFTVYCARAPQARNVLREIGRLREVTFRAAGEGTGSSIDLDTFDYDYAHLFVWDEPAGAVVGAYRLGRTDELLPAKGLGGLYTNTLFDYAPGVLEAIGPALEMGRSFVRPDYQKSYAPLLLLWKGIGHFLVREPRYRYLFGAVSISNSYQSASRQLLVEFLRRHHGGADLGRHVTPRNPFRPRGMPGWVGAAADDADEVSSFVADLEPDQKGVPVLVRQYLKLGAKFLAFHVDRGFGDCVDGLIVVDLLRADPRVLERYMTREGYRSFHAHHNRVGDSAGRVTTSDC